MRIIGGIKGGTVLRVPRHLPVRPTTDFTKESLFNILDNYLYFEDLAVLDIFAGSGNISYEFASRGSIKVLAVEKDPRCCSFIQKESQRLGFSQLEVYQGTEKQFFKDNIETFDLIFMDPPYRFEGYAELIDRSLQPDILNEKGWLIVEHRKNLFFEGHPRYKDHRKYGSTALSFFR